MQPEDTQRRNPSLEAEVSSLRSQLQAALAGNPSDVVTSTGAPLEQVVQSVIDIGVDVSGAAFGAFFYSVGTVGQQMMLYALSGAPRAAFSTFQSPGRTALFGATFDGASIIRSDDILQDPRYGLSPPHHGMPPGHLPVRSYLAASVTAPSGEVLGGLFFGHPRPGVFTEQTERTIVDVAQFAAIALENARLLRAVSDSERRFKALIESSSDGIIVIDTSANYLYVSPAVEAIEGYAPEELIGKNGMERVHPDDLSALQAIFQHVVNSPGEKVPSLHRRRHKDGRWIWIEAIATNLQHDPAVRGIVANFRDVTQRKHSEEALMRSQKMEALGTLAGGIAHDFNNMLLAIAGNTRLAVADLSPGHPVQESLAEIARASQRATDLVARILTFSRQQEPRRDVMSLQFVIDDAVKLLRAILPAMIDMKVSTAPDVPAVYADASQMHQVIMNLVTNSAHAIGERRGTVEIAVYAVSVDGEATANELRPGRYACLSVSDDGCGMDAALMQRIFDPFFTTKPAGRGTGLGLSIVHSIVKSHEGVINVYSHEGKGTTFRICIPAADAAQAPNLVVTSVPAQGRGESVLYVDDDSAIVFLTGRILERLGYRVTGCGCPEEGLAAFRAAPEKFDVVVTDLSMPGMSGFDIARELRLIRPDIPILMTSGYVRPEDRQTAQARGIRELILKPNSVDELGHSLDRVLRELRDERS